MAGKVPRFALVILIVFVSQEALMGWNEATHRAIAFLAWSHVNGKARARISQILQAHPDYATILNPGPERRPSDAPRYVFIAAATWPDAIRADERFSDGKTPRPPLPGFPEMGRHTAWHFINMPFPEEFRNQPVDPDNAVTQLPKLIAKLRKSGPVTPEEAYALPWILHIVSDLHQPLHTVTRFAMVKGKPRHDLGGNGCYVQGARNLHSLWDSLPGTSPTDGSVARLAVSLSDQFPQPRKVNTDPEAWVREGVAMASKYVYSFDSQCDDRDDPARLPAGYTAAATDIARERAAQAAYRLAAILNARLGG